MDNRVVDYFLPTLTGLNLIESEISMKKNQLQPIHYLKSPNSLLLFGNFNYDSGLLRSSHSNCPNLVKLENNCWQIWESSSTDTRFFPPLPDKNGLLTKLTEVCLPFSCKSFCHALPLPNFLSRNNISQPNYAICLRNWIKLI